MIQRIVAGALRMPLIVFVAAVQLIGLGLPRQELINRIQFVSLPTGLQAGLSPWVVAQLVPGQA